ncbi:hypothetical protein F4777DRAFT_290915 [Nemania sp. FL0916]|nr:hypothetical protein F4777DRAFT_290915 [Nemania sp. FL0916]
MRTFLPPGSLITLLLLQADSLLAVGNDFSAYPEAAQPCLYNSADQAGCTSGSSGADLNQCLCKNEGNFIYNTASCVGTTSPADADAVYETLSTNCAGTGVTLSVSKQAFLDTASQASSKPSSSSTTSTTTTTTTSPTSTPATTSSADPSSPTPTNPPDQTPKDPPDPPSADNGLNTGAKIGIGVGVAFGAIAVALLAWFIWLYQKRRRPGQFLQGNEPSNGGPPPPYGGKDAFGMSNQSHHEYAQNNTQQGPIELASGPWRSHTPYTSPTYARNEYKNNMTAGVPLLAELGNGSEAQQRFSELPATPGYLGYSDRSPAAPSEISPASYSHSTSTSPRPVF